MLRVLNLHSLSGRAGALGTSLSLVRRVTLTSLAVLACLCGLEPALAAAAENAPEAVSFHKQIRPLFQTHCQGCHQPARAQGGYVMTTFAQMLAAGESGSAAIVPGQPDQSYLVQQITPVDGKAEMPKNKGALSDTDINLIRRWISEGARDDSPAAAVDPINPQNPPVYRTAPVITSLDYSPDGSLLAVAGFHEVLLWNSDGTELKGRLVGVSDRVETVSFSPDGSKLAVAAGRPGRVGEIQIWDVAQQTLLLSVPTTFDTVYGASWSPDGTQIAYGCGDNSVRAINAAKGEQVLFQGAHNDWVRDTVYSVDGSHLVSVGRDMSTKLTEVTTQRFVDNVTSITPGALKGGLLTVARHPARDEIVIGGSDGVCKVYRMHRLTARVIGDDANLIRKMPPMIGRIFGVAVSRDGKRIAAASSLDGQGQIHVYSYEFDTSLPENIRAIVSKVGYTGEEQQTLEKYYADGVQLVAETKVPQSSMYAVAFHPQTNLIAAAGTDGQVRLIDPSTGAVIRSFVSVPLSPGEADAMAALNASIAYPAETAPTGPELLAGHTLTALEVEPADIVLRSPFDYAQLVVTGVLDNGDRIDLTRNVTASAPAGLAEVTPLGLVRPKADGQGELTVSHAGQSKSVRLEVSRLGEAKPIDFIRDVNPVLSKLGCNQGTCHGSAQGKNGFKLSLRGYDPIFDLRSLTDDLASRRVAVASAADSLMLVKPTGEVPHVGGVTMSPGDPYYETLRRWIAGGAKLDLQTPRVSRIEIFPTNPVVQVVGAQQQMRVIAVYADGARRDVTREAFIETGNQEVATASKTGLMTTLRRGEAAMLARYEGAYAATILTVMGDRTGFVWQQPETYNHIDELVAKKWERMKIQPSGLCTDEEFLRRVSLDLTGLPPTVETTRAFLADPRESRLKRDELIDRLIGSEDYLDHWTNKWADLLQVNRKFLAPEGAMAFRQWIRNELAANTPYDQFVRKILTASGSNKDNPAAAYFKVLRTPEDTMENSTHLFLAVRFNCNKCHDHPFERWTQDQYYQTAAYFAQVARDRDPASGDRSIGGTAVEGALPLYEVIGDRPSGDVVHDRTKQVTPPQFPYSSTFQLPEGASRREQMAAWTTSADNVYFAKSYVNRLWGYLLGVGIMEPIDDIRAGNPPSNPELLEHLTQEFLQSGFDVRHMVRLICQSRTYQLSIESNRFNEDDKTNYSHAQARRLPAEVLYDAVQRVTGSTSSFPGVAPGTRAAALPDSGVDLPSGFLQTFGRPVRESACECERTGGLQLGPVLALVSGPTISDAIGDPGNAITKLAHELSDDAELIRELFLRTLNRPATPEEVNGALAVLGSIDQDHQRLIGLRAEREVEAAKIHERLAAEREQAMSQAQAALAAYEAEYRPRRAAEEAAQQQRIADREGALKQYDQTTLRERMETWARDLQMGPQWHVLKATSLEATAGVMLTQGEDGSILATGPLEKTIYTIVAETDVDAITGIRLEALTDPNLPSMGPGRPPNGNFVLNEFEVELAARTPEAVPTGLKLANPLADFAQDNFPIAAAIDAKREEEGNGWATVPKTGQPHWATFEVETVPTHTGGSRLVIRLHQNYTDKQHSLGKFRLSVTNSPKPIGLSVPGALGQLAQVPGAERTPEQTEQLVNAYRDLDEEYRRLAGELYAARQPLPPDARLMELEAAFAGSQMPVPPDARLAELTSNVSLSEQQINDRRLTAAQDLVWALINSPEFLFNH